MTDNTENVALSESTSDQIQYQQVAGFRANSELIYTIQEKQLYVKNKRLRDGTVAYTFKEKLCKSRVYLRMDGVLFEPQNFVLHSHGDKEEEAKKMKVLNELKTKCTTLPNEYATKNNGTTRDIFVDVLSK